MKRIKALAALAALLSLGRGLLGGPPPPHDVVKDPTSSPPAASKDNTPVSPLDFKVKSIDGKDQNLADYKGKVVMLVNVASKCGFTKQYKPLEAVYQKYADKGFVVIGFPANNFGHQEPGTDAEIKEFCSSTYDVKFPMMSKISVKGDDKAPLYEFLTSDKTNGDFGGEIGWNFTKFLIDRNGNVIARYSSQTTPDSAGVTEEIEKALAAKSARVSRKAFFSTDDGQTWFADDAANIPPFEHDGKPAYRALVYRCPDGTEFVGRLERFSPEAKATMEEQIKKNPKSAPVLQYTTSMAALEVKKPGQQDWVKLVGSPPEVLHSLLQPTCPKDGSTTNVVPVRPEK